MPLDYINFFAINLQIVVFNTGTTPTDRRAYPNETTSSLIASRFVRSQFQFAVSTILSFFVFFLSNVESNSQLTLLSESRTKNSPSRP